MHTMRVRLVEERVKARMRILGDQFRIKVQGHSGGC